MFKYFPVKYQLATMIVLKPPKILMINTNGGNVCHIIYNGYLIGHSQMWQFEAVSSHQVAPLSPQELK